MGQRAVAVTLGRALGWTQPEAGQCHGAGRTRGPTGRGLFPIVTRPTGRSAPRPTCRCAWRVCRAGVPQKGPGDRGVSASGLFGRRLQKARAGSEDGVYQCGCPRAGVTASTAGAQGLWGHGTEPPGHGGVGAAPQLPRVLLFQPAARGPRRATGRGSQVPAGVLRWHPQEQRLQRGHGGTRVASLVKRKGGKEGREGGCGFREPLAPETSLSSPHATAVARPRPRGVSQHRGARSDLTGLAEAGGSQGSWVDASCHGNRCRLRSAPSSCVLTTYD